jgi:hypothetical protein
LDVVGAQASSQEPLLGLVGGARDRLGVRRGRIAPASEPDE